MEEINLLLIFIYIIIAVLLLEAYFIINYFLGNLKIDNIS